LAFVLDFIKGLAPVVLCGFLSPNLTPTVYITVGLAAVFGHNWPVFLKFKGGKGVSTSLGVVLGLSALYPNFLLAILAAVLGWVTLFKFSRYVSIASLGAAFILALAACFASLPQEIKVFSGLIFVFILIRHKNNIKSLLSRKENRF
jgi:acyl phosphate:glycerol-3-phosphate acyltransferase